MQDDENVPLKKHNFSFFLCLLVWEHILMAHFNLVPADIMKNHGVYPVPLGKWSELPGFSKHQPSEVQCPNLLDFWICWGKVMERSSLRFKKKKKKNTHKWYKIPAKRKLVFWPILPYRAGFFGIGATIHICREILCLRHAGFFGLILGEICPF